MRTRPPRAGTIVADAVEFLCSRESGEIRAIRVEVNARRARRGLPAVSADTIRGQLNSNVVGKGHELFERTRRGLYVLAKRGSSS
jgi:hypothetical protein